MGLLANDMMRLVGEIHAGRDDRRRLLRDLKHATVEMRRAVAHLRSRFAVDLAGARAAWFGAMAPVPREAGAPKVAAPGGWSGLTIPRSLVRTGAPSTVPTVEGPEAEAKTRFGDQRRNVKAKPQARDKARTVRKTRKRPRLR